MTHLTIETMDKINFMITEVSLECLGNKFFDIYGNQASSLLRLISVNSLKSERTDADDESDLWKSLTTEKKKKIIVPVEKIVPSVVPQISISRKRRASFSNTNNDVDTSNDPESLLVPMPPKAAKIMNRRSTIAIQAVVKNRKHATIPPGPKSRKKIIEAALAREAIAREAQSQAQLQMMRNRMQTFDTPHVSGASIADIQESIRTDTNARKNCFNFKLECLNSFVINVYKHIFMILSSLEFYVLFFCSGYNAMRLLSETQEEKYRTLNINPNMSDFYEAEKRNLLTQCNTLVKFIGFIQEDSDNAMKLANVSQAILDLRNEY